MEPGYPRVFITHVEKQEGPGREGMRLMRKGEQGDSETDRLGVSTEQEACSGKEGHLLLGRNVARTANQ